MALWKAFRGNRAALADVAKHDGHVYFCVDDGSLFFDYIDSDGNLQRKQLNDSMLEKIDSLDASLTGLVRSNNLFDISKVQLDEGDSVDYTTGKITLRYEGDGSGTRQGAGLGLVRELCPEMEVGKTYTISWKDNTSGATVFCHCGLHEDIPFADSGHSFVANEEIINNGFVFFVFPNSGDYNDLYVDFWDIMINEGEEELPYEPYYKLGAHPRIDALENTVTLLLERIAALEAKLDEYIKLDTETSTAPLAVAADGKILTVLNENGEECLLLTGDGSIIE